jgi:hypothetical protein
MLKLIRYKVLGFRSVKDSGWIETDSSTALIGVNESGKTNLLLPLWKLNPANEGEIVPLADYPRAEYVENRHNNNRVFIVGEFETDEDFKDELAKLTNFPREEFSRVRFSRLFSKQYQVSFPTVMEVKSVSSKNVDSFLTNVKSFLSTDVSSDDEVLRTVLLEGIDKVWKILESFNGEIDSEQLLTLQTKLSEIPLGKSDCSLVERWKQCLSDFSELSIRIGLIHPDNMSKAREAALEHMPSFVYYSNYGNLDSEIYLPHVIQNLERKDLGAKNTAKVRTLRVLFDFVKLKPQEILDLGKSMTDGKEPTPEQIEDAAKKTKERSVLLQSASTKLTKEFKNWWKQGNYRFRFEADGDHFRIWVSDDQRPEEIELEARSTGLQWFLSFFLVFLVESKNAHEDTILLLDEPGLSLHPLAQKDLTLFFDGLAENNQLLYTTHSPFLIDPDRLDRVRAVYIEEDGTTAVSENLRAGKASSPEFRSIYAVHGALGLSVSDALLQGCTNVIVEGPSDQFYMSGIKTVLIALGEIIPQRELLFFPGGGAKGVKALVPILAGKDEDPPHVILDSDQQGLQFAKDIKEGHIYKGNHADRVRCVGELVKDIKRAEIEDLVHHELMTDVVGRLYRGEEDFADVANRDEPIVPQIEAYAKNNNIHLDNGWKVVLAKTIKQRLVKSPEKIPRETIQLWVKLFEPFSSKAGGISHPTDQLIPKSRKKSR